MEVSAVLLSGGESRRMGRDKALLPFRGGSLWQKQLGTLREIKPAELLLSARTDPAWRPDDVKWLTDLPPSRGPLSGVDAALRRMRGIHLLVLAIDLPFMTASYLRSLSDTLCSGKGVVPVLNDQAEPLAAIYPAEAQPDVANALATGNFSLQSLIRDLVGKGKMSVRPITKEEADLFRNINEPSDVTWTEGPICPT